MSLKSGHIGGTDAASTEKFTPTSTVPFNNVQDAIEYLRSLIGSHSHDHGTLTGLTDDDHAQYSLISSQAGAPGTTPSRVGLLNIDTTDDNIYISVDVASSADWKLVDVPPFAGLTITGTDGIDFNPGSDAHVNLITVGVTGTPRLDWNEASDGFHFSTGVIISDDEDGELTHTISGLSIESQLELHSEGAGDLGGMAIHRHTNSNGFGGHMLFMRSDGDHTTPTVVVDNDVLARMIGLGFDGTDYELAAEIRFITDGTPGNDDMPGEIKFLTNAGGQTLTERMAIRANGNVEIAGTVLTLNAVAVPTISSSDTLTNKTIALGSNTVSGTSAQFDTANTDGNFAFDGGAHHDGFSDFVANEHIDHSTVTLTAGNGLTGGGTIAANRTFAVGAGTGIDVNANDIEVEANTRTATIAFVIDGGGSAIATGIHGDLSIDFACTIQGVRLLADQSGSIVVDIWKDTYANFPPTDADSITASAVPTISTATKDEDTTLTGWTTSISAGDILRFNVDSVTTIERVTVSLDVVKT